MEVMSLQDSPERSRICRNKLQWNTVHTMAFVGGSREPFTFEYMTQMPSAGRTCDFNSHSIWVWLKTWILHFLLVIQIKLRVWYLRGSCRQKERKSAHSAVDGSGEALKESRPTTSGVEFCRGFVKRSPASSTVIHSLFEELVIRSCAWISALQWNHVKSSNLHEALEIYVHAFPIWVLIQHCDWTHGWCLSPASFFFFLISGFLLLVACIIYHIWVLNRRNPMDGYWALEHSSYMLLLG